MDDTTAPCAEKASLKDQLKADYTRAQVMALVAKFIAEGCKADYCPGGRAWPDGFDGFGFVRWCASFAVSWWPGVGYRSDPAVLEQFADLRDYMGWPDHDPSCEAICAAIESWGMERIERGHPLKTLPGDIIITQGHGPDCCIVTDAGNQDRGELVAMVWAPKGPEIRSNTVYGRVPYRAYRWPSAASAEA